MGELLKTLDFVAQPFWYPNVFGNTTGYLQLRPVLALIGHDTPRIDMHGPANYYQTGIDTVGYVADQYRHVTVTSGCTLMGHGKRSIMDILALSR